MFTLFFFIRADTRATLSIFALYDASAARSRNLDMTTGNEKDAGTQYTRHKAR